MHYFFLLMIITKYGKPPKKTENRFQHTLNKNFPHLSYRYHHRPLIKKNNKNKARKSKIIFNKRQCLV